MVSAGDSDESGGEPHFKLASYLEPPAHAGRLVRDVRPARHGEGAAGAAATTLYYVHRRVAKLAGTVARSNTYQPNALISVIGP